MDEQQFVIVGAGLAGATAAATLRAEGFTQNVVLIGNEGRLPYLRPPLSKGYLAGKDTEESLLPYPADWYSTHGIRLERGDAVVAVDPAARSVTLSGGAVLNYSALLLATGATPRHLGFPGAGLAGVHVLRTLDQSHALRQELEGGGRNVVLIGSGWIGMEVAATARELGNEVTLIGRDEVPLSAVLGTELGNVFARRQREAGVRLLMSNGVEHATGVQGHVAAVHTSNSEVVPADVVVVAAGVVPNTDLAQACGLELRNGIVVDAALRTSDPAIFAAGDVANPFHPVTGTHFRSEHWANAMASGTVAAKSMLGQTAELTEIPYFYTDQFDLGMEYSGFAAWTQDARVVIRGSVEHYEFVAFWLRDGRVAAGMNVNVWDVQDAIKDLIRSGRQVDPGRLADSQIPLEAV